LRSYRLGIPGALVALTTLIGGAVSILSIAVRLHPALESVKHLKESVDLYSQYIRTPLMRSLAQATGLEFAGFLAAGTAVDLLVFWVMFFIAVNVFVHNASSCPVISPAAIASSRRGARSRARRASRPS
jgi:hypothetical protein